MKLAEHVASASYCNRRKVGCIIVKDDNIVSFGYNGTPRGFDNTCEVDNVTIPEVIHAESNAITKCAKTTLSSIDSDMYVTLSPCVECAKLIIQAGIKNLYYRNEYSCTKGIELLLKSKINVFNI